jgi:hypothetical protein
VTKRIAIHGLPTLPRDGELTEYFPPNHGNPCFRGRARRHAFAVKKPRLAARKIAQIPVAFSSPQDFHIALMFGTARFGEPAFKWFRLCGISHRAAPTSFAAARRHTA